MSRKGFTLIEALTLLFVFSLVTTTFYAVFTAGTRQIIESKNRLGAVAVANEKMEIIRNLDYDAIGTKRLNNDGSYSYGIPSGDILEDESVTVNTRVFEVHSFIQYVDDAYDGKVSGTTPLDAVPNDYKRVKIEVSWGVGGATHTVSLVSTFVPKGVEVSSGGGTLSLNIIDNSGSGVSQASVRITNTSVSPHVDISTNTDSTGNLMLPGAAASSQSYQIQVSKSDYYGVTTYPPYPSTAYVPVDIHASVVADAFNQKTLVMDRSSDIVLSTKDAFGADLPDIGFHIEGGRKNGDSVPSGGESSVPVYSLDQDADSGADARETFSLQSSGTYALTLTDASRYRLLRLGSDESVQNAFSVFGGAAANIDAIIADTQIPAALFTVTDSSSGTALPIQNASIHLSSVVLGYDATVLTDRYGQAYFPTSLPALSAGTYDYTVTAAGYSDESGTTVVGSDMKIEDIGLTAS